MVLGGTPMNSKHTPGPWYAYSPLKSGVHAGHHYKVANSRPCGVVEDEDGRLVPDFPDWGPDSRIICTTTDDEMSRANAILISAAPDLLAACKAAQDELVALTVVVSLVADKARSDAAAIRVRAITQQLHDAIAKAEGGAE